MKHQASVSPMTCLPRSENWERRASWAGCSHECVEIAEGDKTIFGVTVEEFDYHHEAIVQKSLRVGCPGFYSDVAMEW